MIKDYVLPGFQTPNGIDSTDIETIPGTTVSRLAFDASSQDKLYNIIDSSRLSNGLKNRAKYVVGALDQGRQDVLLLDVMLDGVDAYFSREALDQGAYSLAAGDTKRLYENAVLPGEGPARRVLEARLNSGALGRNAGNEFAGAAANTATNTMAGTGGVLNAEAQRTGNALMLTAAKGAPIDMAEVEEKRDKYNNLVWELQALENRISQISIWEKIPFFYSERYQDALTRKGELRDGIAQLETELDKLYPKWSVLEIPSAGQPTATLQPKPSATPKPTPSPMPMPTPSPTPKPSPTPLPAYMKDAPAPDNAKLAAHWGEFLRELEQTIPVDGGLTAEQRFKIIQESAEYIGKYPYCDKKHPDGKDCADLVKALYDAAGISLHGTSDKLAEYVFTSGWGIEKSELQPGDLIFWDDSDANDRWNNIHHVGIYLYTDIKGRQWIIDSTPSEGGPAIQELWAENERQVGFKVYGYASLRDIA